MAPRSATTSTLRTRAWNAGWGTPLAVREIVDRLIAVSGRETEPDIQGEGTPHCEIDRQYLVTNSDGSRAERSTRGSRQRGTGTSSAWREVVVVVVVSN